MGMRNRVVDDTEIPGHPCHKRPGPSPGADPVPRIPSSNLSRWRWSHFFVTLSSQPHLRLWVFIAVVSVGRRQRSHGRPVSMSQKTSKGRPASSSAWIVCRPDGSVGSAARSSPQVRRPERLLFGRSFFSSTTSFSRRSTCSDTTETFLCWKTGRRRVLVCRTLWSDWSSWTTSRPMRSLESASCCSSSSSLSLDWMIFCSSRCVWRLSCATDQLRRSSSTARSLCSSDSAGFPCGQQPLCWVSLDFGTFFLWRERRYRRIVVAVLVVGPGAGRQQKQQTQNSHFSTTNRPNGTRSPKKTTTLNW